MLYQPILKKQEAERQVNMKADIDSRCMGTCSKVCEWQTDVDAD